MGKHRLKRGNLIDTVTGALASAPLIEALAPGKLSTVSWLEGVKDLGLLDYVLTPVSIAAPIREAVRDGVAGRPLRFGELVLKGVRATVENRLVGTNTVLGYLMLAVPLSYALGIRLGRAECFGGVEDVAAECSEVVKPYLETEDCGTLYDAILRACGCRSLRSFIGRVPDVTSCAGKVCGASVWEVLSNSSYYDLNSAEITRGFKLTRLALAELKRRLRPAPAGALPKAEDLLNAVLVTHTRLLSEVLDTLVVRSWGLPTAELVRSLARGLTPSSPAWGRASRFLRTHDVNPGSVSDVLAAAVALYLVGVSIEGRYSR